MAIPPVATETRRGLPLFTIAGIQIRLDFSWFIIFLLVIWSLSAGYFPRYYPDQSAATYWTAGLIATLLFFASILAHELAHSLVAIRSGLHIPAITLFVFGGMAHLAEEAKNPKTELQIALVGPLTSFALAAIFWGIKTGLEETPSSLAVVIVEYLAWINLALGIFNLLPGFPLDGGRVFRALWWWKTGSFTRATKAASDIGKGLALMLMILGGLQIFSGALVGGLWFLFIGMFLRGMAEGGYQQVVIKQSLAGVEAQDVMVQDIVSVPPDLPLNQLVTEYFLRYGYRGFPVTRNGEILGVISLVNVKVVSEAERSSKTVREVMVPLSSRIQITPEAPLAEALQKMMQEEVGRLLVMRDGKMAGMVTRTGLLRFLEVKRALEGTA